jgi:hypothetical protein
MTARAGTEVEAANLALGHLGRDGIASLDDNSTRARAVRTFFASVRDALQQKENWGFCTGYDTPAEMPPPAGGWPGPFKKRYALPADCLKVRSVECSGANEWEVLSDAADPAGSEAEVKVLATNLTAPKVCYTRLIAAVRLWSPKFLTAFSHELAAAIAPKLTGSTAKADSERNFARAEIDDAAVEDGKERSRREVSRNTSWLAARRRGGARGRF